MQPTNEAALTLFDRLIVQARVTLKAPEMDRIHDVRVATRRLIQGLVAFEHLLRKRQAAKLRKRVKHLLSLAGDVRDCDIALKLLSRKAEGREALLAKIERRRSSAVKEWKSATRSWLARHDALPWKEDGPQLSFEEVAAATLPSAIKKFFADGKKVASGKIRARELHRFRVAAKKFRYTLELFANVYGPALDERMADLRAVQTALGDVNDYRAARDLFEKLDADEELTSGLRKKQRKRTEEFRLLWEERFAPRGTRRAWLATVQPPEAQAALAGTQA